MNDVHLLGRNRHPIVRNTCKTPGAPEGTPGFTVLTTPDAQQRRALELLQSITV